MVEHIVNKKFGNRLIREDSPKLIKKRANIIKQKKSSSVLRNKSLTSSKEKESETKIQRKSEAWGKKKFQFRELRNNR